jgi:crotonobetainyl-CoA:carnitine CoA-transferase CaiB-like acyl-CoA transferase
MSVTEIGRRAWADLGEDLTTLQRVEPPAPPVGLDAEMDVDGLLADSVALATLALQEAGAARGGVSEPTTVHVDGDRIRTSAQWEHHLVVDGHRPSAWAPLSGFWDTADGWVRTHGNYPHHARRLAQLLGVNPDGLAKAVAAEAAEAMLTWSAFELEDHAAAFGAIVGAVRDPAQWQAHPQAKAVEGLPLLAVRTEPAPPRPWRAGGVDRPLAGVRVLDLTRVLAGPVASRDLALAGAEVLRVDSPRLAEIDWQHLETGHGKRSTLLDLDSFRGRGTFEALLSVADVVITGYRPHALCRFGLDPCALAAEYPGLVIASVSAWGTVGPWSRRRGFDSIVQAVTGIAVRQSSDGVTPGALPAQALDHSAGHFLAAGIASALRRQRAEGGTWVVEVALARLGQALLETTSRRAAPAGAPTLQSGFSAAGEITCAAPALTLAHGPALYPGLAGPWGCDEPRWR